MRVGTHRNSWVALFGGLILGFCSASLSASDATFRVAVEAPQTIVVDSAVTLSLVAQNKEGAQVKTDTGPVLLTVSKWQDRRNFSLFLANGKASQAMTLDKVGNWIVTVKRDDKILYSGVISVKPEQPR